MNDCLEMYPLLRLTWILDDLAGCFEFLERNLAWIREQKDVPILVPHLDESIWDGSTTEDTPDLRDGFGTASVLSMKDEPDCCVFQETDDQI